MCLQETLLAAAFMRAIRVKPNSLMLHKNTIKAERGIVMPIMAMALLTLTGFMGLAVDVGYLYMVRNELQNAADAAALAGAGHIFSSTASTPNFTVASAAANNAISNLNNTAANAPLVTATITTGYWSLSGSPSGLHATPVVGGNDFPAVEVDITKNGANGAVNTFFSQVLGITSFNPMARAVAVITGPGQANVFPMAISDCLFQPAYWNLATNSPMLATTTTAISPPSQNLTQIVGQPYMFQLNNSKPGYETFLSPSGLNCHSGIWTSLNSSPPSTATIDGFITNTIQASVNQLIYLYTAIGTKTALYQDTPLATYVVVPVVSNIDLINGTSPSNIKSFACIYISNAVPTGPNKYISAQLVAIGNPSCKVTGGSGFGNINYGALLPPRLVNYQGNTYTPFD